MTANEACKILLNEIDGMNAVSCTEYDSRFVFQLVPKNFDTASGDTLFSGLYSVDKSTGEVRDFKPFHIPVSEYQKGRPVADFI